MATEPGREPAHDATPARKPAQDQAPGPAHDATPARKPAQEQAPGSARGRARLATRRPTRRAGWIAVAAGLALVAVGFADLVRPGADSPAPADRPSPTAPLPAPVLVAYVPYWDQERGLASLRRNQDLFEEVSPFWYSLDQDGRVVLADDAHTRVDRPAVRELQRRGIRVLPTVTNLRNGDWAPDLVRDMLHDPAAMRRHVGELVDIAVGEGYDGIDLDYESLRAADRDAYSAFLRALAAALHANGKLLTTSVHPKVSDAGYDERNAAQDFRAIGAAVDQVRVMAYDYHWETSPPGAVAPADWVEDVVAWTVTQIPPEKVVLGAALLGYDWVGSTGSTVDHEMATALAATHRATIGRAADGSPWFTYRDKAGRAHTVWWEDAFSVAGKLRLVAKYRLRGAFFWRLGGEDPAVWPAVRALPPG
jgi:spore germination protein